MVNKNIKKIFLFVSLFILLAGIAYAEDFDSDDSIVPTDTMTDQTTNMQENIKEVSTDEAKDNKEIIKYDKTQDNIKAATSKVKTKVSIDYIYDISIDDFGIIMGSLKDVNNNIITNAPVKVDVSGETYNVKTDEDGDYTIEYIPSLPGTKTVTVSFAGNSLYESSTTKGTFTVTGQAPTYVDLDDIKDVNLGQTVKISGYYTYGNNIPITITTMRINVNGKNLTAKTDNKGYFTLNYTTTKTGTNTVNVSYPGTTRFIGASATDTFNVKAVGPQSTYVVLNNIADVAYGGYTTISGYYYYGDKIPLTYTNMRVNINGKTVLAKTDAKGYFTYSHKTDMVGKNTVNVSYPGNTNFKTASATKTFNVKITSPIATYIKLNTIKEVNNGQTTTISGYYYYGNNMPLTLTTMRININGQTYTAKTDNTGYFTYNYKTTKDGTNTVTVSYPGNSNFKNASATKTFNVKSVGPKSTYFKLNDVSEVAYNAKTRISGYYYYGNNVAIANVPVTISVNGNTVATPKTDSKGYFTYDYQTQKVYKNTLTVSYAGNTNYKEASATKTFNVKITTPIATTIQLDEIRDIEELDYTTISGYYYYGKNMPLSQTKMTININGNKYQAVTDNDGYFYYDYKGSKLGKNNVTVSYQGNTNFKSATVSKSFMVYNLELYTYELKGTTPATRLNIGNDLFDAWYQTSDSKYEKGVHVVVNSLFTTSKNKTPENLIFGAKFIFENSNGKVYSDYYTSGNGTEMNHTLYSGYTPVKILVAYRKLTSDEKTLWNKGYAYNPSTGKWYLPG